MAKKSSLSPILEIDGIAASPGVAVGKVQLLEELHPSVEEHPVADSAPEIARFRRALARSREELEELREVTRRDLGEEEARIFDVQLLALEDPLIVDRTVEAIAAEGRNAEFLLARHCREIADHLESVNDDVFSLRAVDVHDIKRRVLGHLAGRVGLRLPTKPVVLLGREIAPSDAVHLDPKLVMGIATERGGVTSHASIMARARGIPAVVGLHRLGEAAKAGDVVAVDGITGKVTVNPAPHTLDRLRKRRQAFVRLQRQREKHAEGDAVTREGVRVLIGANMEIPEELDYILDRGADAIGLFRTEFFFMLHHRHPTEEEQYAAYSAVAKQLGDRRMVIRALDVGGDKFASYLSLPAERNPYLGMRGIRYLLNHTEVFETQLRAILRAGVHGTVRIMFPMIHSVDEFEEARRMVRSVSAGLSRKGIAHDANPQLGVMIEVPSAVLMAEELAARADFLSVGSNDLIQYLLAIDRDHEGLRDLYQPLHPAVLRAVSRVSTAAAARGRWVSMCGEMAADPLSIPLLLGMGIDRLSVSPYLLPEVKQTVRRLRMADCRALAQEALRLSRASDVVALVEDRLGMEYSTVLRLRRDGNGGAAGGQKR